MAGYLEVIPTGDHELERSIKPCGHVDATSVGADRKTIGMKEGSYQRNNRKGSKG